MMLIKITTITTIRRIIMRVSPREKMIKIDADTHYLIKITSTKERLTMREYIKQLVKCDIEKNEK